MSEDSSGRGDMNISNRRILGNHCNTERLNYNLGCTPFYTFIFTSVSSPTSLSTGLFCISFPLLLV